MSDLIIEVEQGKLRGERKKSCDGVYYNSFSGIPYAKPPVGDLRFKDPQPAYPWSGVRDATSEGNMAPQYSMLIGDGFTGDEDCLFLNVYVPAKDNTKNQSLFPVMVNIHGGGFVIGSGSASFMGPDLLVAQDVVVVQFNYRLGIMGFLCTDSVNARGDMGLKDQNMALKWVRDNIRRFGGDPENVTLFGISAGGASVEYHLLSKMSRGLFHRAIMQSGSVLNPWARTLNGVEMSKRLAVKLGYKLRDSRGLFDFINGHDTKTLVVAAHKLLDETDIKNGRLFCFTPVLCELDGYDGFIDDEPSKLLEYGDFAKVPTISGLCEKEGVTMLIFYNLFEKCKRDLEARRFYDYLPSHFKNGNDLEALIRGIYRKREGDRNRDDDLYDFLSDVCFNGGVVYSLHQRCKNNPEDDFFYSFSQDGELNGSKRFMGFDVKGSCHGDDGCYIATSPLLDRSVATAEDLKVSAKMVEMWTNFAKRSNPTPFGFEGVKWLPAVSNDDNKYLSICGDMKMHSDFNPERTRLWNKIYGNIDFQRKRGKQTRQRQISKM